MKKTTSESLETRVSRFLFHYRITPHSKTGIAPAQMLMGRKLRSHLSILIPNSATRIKSKQRIQKEHYDKWAKERELTIGTSVLRNFPDDNSWLRGILKDKSGPLSFTIELDDGWIIRRHLDHIRLYEVLDLRSKDSGATFPHNVEIPLSQPKVVNSETVESNVVPPPRHSSRYAIPLIDINQKLISMTRDSGPSYYKWGGM